MHGPLVDFVGDKLAAPSRTSERPLRQFDPPASRASRLQRKRGGGIMNALRCLRVVARPSGASASLLAPAATPRFSMPSTARSISFLTPRRPMLPAQSTGFTLPTPGSVTSPAIFSAETLDLASKISVHPAMGSMQIRCGPRDTYNPSHLVRKRRHGFLSRIRTKKGRKLLMRRLKKGRWNLSH
ncbi:hypothetical protein PMIN07_002589 [Paraphaeosphaeria minitans]